MIYDDDAPRRSTEPTFLQEAKGSFGGDGFCSPLAMDS
jgi:hypothetical protein